ncbi:hypothetical protein Lal_00028431 [Lupinus albus]|nr:hypothetical protein Lal_00028431 [Lupinus albus]
MRYIIFLRFLFNNIFLGCAVEEPPLKTFSGIVFTLGIPNISHSIPAFAIIKQRLVEAVLALAVMNQIFVEAVLMFAMVKLGTLLIFFYRLVTRGL